MRSAILILILSILSFQALLGLAHGSSGDMISDPISTHEVFVDGKWTYPNEWSDAVKTELLPKCTACSSTAYLYAKHDESCFYFLIDFVSATRLNNATDGASIAIDSAHDGGIANVDDRKFDTRFPANGTMDIGTGESTWNSGNPLPHGVYMAASLSPSPNSPLSHEIFEFKIAFSAFPNQMQQVIGFTASAYTADQLVNWPVNSSTSAPNTWAEVALSPTPIPEFNILIVAVAVTMLLTLIAPRFRLNSKVSRQNRG